MLIFLVTILNWSKLTSKSQQGWKFMFYDESITLNSKQFFSSHLWASFNSWGMNFLFYSFSRAAVMMVEGKAHTRAEKMPWNMIFLCYTENDFCFKDLQLFPLLVLWIMFMQPPSSSTLLDYRWHQICFDFQYRHGTKREKSKGWKMN